MQNLSSKVFSYRIVMLQQTNPPYTKTMSGQFVSSAARTKSGKLEGLAAVRATE
jgi:hypothetical protein